ncbi:MAG: acetolactate decarboxylase [Actinomycetota bacterium]
MAIDERLIGALHVDRLRATDLHAESEPHVVFQASSIAALLDGYDGDVTFAELEEHGDLGLGTLNGCDGEMIAVDGRFLRADAEGNIHEIPPSARTPFAVLTFFDPRHRLRIAGPLDEEELLATIDREVGHPDVVHAMRVEGRFGHVRARSVPRQSKPYRPLVEVVADQRVFEFTDVRGTIVGFRFPDYAEGLNVPGYHLHFVTSDRTRGGHVLDCSVGEATIEVDDSVDVHLEVPAGVEVGGPSAGASKEALRRVEKED